MTATSTSRPRQAHVAKTTPVANPRFELTNDLVELSLLMYYGETEPYHALLKDCGRDGRSKHPEPEPSDALETACSAGRSLTKEKERERVLTPLDVLTSPLREPEVIDRWSPYEIAVFEACLCRFGEGAWDKFPAFIPRKSPQEIAEFFKEVFTKTRRYSLFKAASSKN